MNDTSTALAVVEGNPAPKLPKAPLVAGSTPRAIVPVDFDGAYRIANVVVTAGMAPKTLNTIEKAMVAIMHGLEVGLTPMNALQSIAVINGRPTIWGDGAIGLIRGSGLLEYMHERFEGTGPELTAVCIVKRKGEPKEVRGEFSWSDVLRANLNNKEGPWQTYPRRMMQMRARWPLRDVFADVLKGLALKEEVEDMYRADVSAPADHDQQGQHDIPEREQAPRRRVPSPPAAEVAKEPEKKVEREKPADGFPGDKKMVTAAPQPTKESPIPFMLDRKLSESEQDWLTSLHEAFQQCSTVEEIGSEQDSLMSPSQATVSPYAWQRASDMLDQHIERVS